MLRTPLYALTGAVLLVLSIAAAPVRAATVTYTIDPVDLNSSLGFLSGNFAGGAASLQPNSVNTVSVSGTIVAERVGNTIEFLPDSGGVAIVAFQSGKFPPGTDGTPIDTAAANFALRSTSNSTNVAVRDFRFFPVSSSGPSTINGAGNFSGSAYDINFDDGTIDYAVGLSAANGSHNLRVEIGVPNASSGNASVTQGGGKENLLLPIRITIPFFVLNDGDSTVTFNGILRASADVPEPASATLLLAPLAILTLRRRKQR